jgi:hypothetical protein
VSRWPDSAAGTSPHAARARGRIRADVVYLGWQQVPAEPDPGPPPVPPAQPQPDAVSPDWLAAQRREHSRLNRPARLAAAIAVATLTLAALASGTGHAADGLAPAVAILACCVTAVSGRQIWRGQRALIAQIRDEELRVAAFRRVQRGQYADRQRLYAEAYRDWRQQTAAVRRQPQWHPVTVPTATYRIDIAGGTLAGWSALLTMLAAPRLATGSEVTVVDLTEGGVAADLLAVAHRSGIDPLVWVLPSDLPQLDLGMHLTIEQLADVLARTVSAAVSATGAGPVAATADPAGDSALLRRVLHALGGDAARSAPVPATARDLATAPESASAPESATAPEPTTTPTMAELIAALRVLGQIGAPADHLRSATLTSDQLARLASLAGRGAEQLVVQRAWVLESVLAMLAPVATNLTSRPPSRLKVAWLDRRATAVGNRVMAAYLTVALTELLRQAPSCPRWQQTLCLLGAERLPGDVLDRLCDAAEIAGAGLVLAYRTIPAHVRERLGRGDAAVGFMRLGNADDARIAAEQIGTEHRFVISQLTDTVGASVTDTIGQQYTSNVGNSESVADSASFTLTGGHSRGRGRSRHGMLAPFADFTGSASKDVSSSAAVADSESITHGISTGTSWGWSTARAVGASDSLARTAQRSRESLVEQHELQQLPQSAVLLCYPAPGGRQVVLADANPAIMTLPTATLALRTEPGGPGRGRVDCAGVSAFRPDSDGGRPGSM